ncbi:quinone-dependent dihydroorotate dehydrogenase [Candidatus Pacearchaeota archaeon]|nr:quinone-dependent dihydroorotate dehydrogenase [Candidatus Pacearchaeota archaeon]
MGRKIINAFNRSSYKIVKNIAFKFDPENVHNFFIRTGKRLQSNKVSRRVLRAFFSYKNRKLEQNLGGIRFANPVGLSAGFDKNAEIINTISDVGFGFSEVGSITAKACKGNDGVRLRRLPEKKSLWVNFGLNNDGADKIARRLQGKKFSIPVGISVAKTNCKETVDLEVGVEDYLYTLKTFNFLNIGEYFTINISCPNAYGGLPFTQPKYYEALLKKLIKLKIRRPLFVKFSPDLDKKNIDAIIKISEKYKIDGFICANLTKQHKFGKGGLSGKAVDKLSDWLISYVHKKTKGEKIIIGVGGVFSAEDAYRKIKLGANLVQLIAGMIYNGPGVISEINYNLVKLLEKDGYKNISEAVGKN